MSSTMGKMSPLHSWKGQEKLGWFDPQHLSSIVLWMPDEPSNVGSKVSEVDVWTLFHMDIAFGE